MINVLQYILYKKIMLFYYKKNLTFNILILLIKTAAYRRKFSILKILSIMF